jgi:hypothetical protein
MSYTVYNGYDYKSRDPNAWTYQTEDACKTICNLNDKCVGFVFDSNATSYNAHNCFLLNTSAGKVQSLIDPTQFVKSAGVNSYILNSQPQPNVMVTSQPYDRSQLTSYASANKIQFPNSCTDDQCKIETVQKAMRDNVDRKVAEIYRAPGTYTRAFDENYQITMLTGGIWALLGTSVLYYTFKKI